MPEWVILLGGTFLVCVVSGLIPVVNAELFLVGLTYVVSGPILIPIALFAALGQMTAKMWIFRASKGITDAPKKGKIRQKIDQYRRALEEHRTSPMALVFVSSFVGIPPFYVISILAGAAKISVRGFVIFGFVGRLLRFGLCVAAGEAAMQWL